MTIEASQRHDGAILVLLPKGRIEARDIEQFEKPIWDRIRNGDRNIIIDLEDVEYIDAACVQSLLTIAAKLVINRGRLVICGIRANALALLKLTSFDQVVRTVETYEEAVASFRDDQNQKSLENRG